MPDLLKSIVSALPLMDSLLGSKALNHSYFEIETLFAQILR
jgi:hypothetical protein